jgi:hypothetical protein
MGEKFGSATITSRPSASRQRAITNSLSVEASGVRPDPEHDAEAFRLCTDAPLVECGCPQYR